MAEMLRRKVLDLPGPRDLSDRLTPEDLLLRKLWWGFLEISDSLQSLANLRTYVNRAPHSRSKLPQLSYLRMIIETYLNEQYILSERLHSYITVIERVYRKSDRALELKKELNPLHASISASFRIVNQVRGAHVHVTRYSDDNLDRLATLEILSSEKLTSESERKLFMRLFKLEYRSLRNKWSDSFKSNNIALNGFFDHFFGVLLRVVFDQQSRIIYPWDHKTIP